MKEVSFIRLVVTDNGLCVDPDKVQAIKEMSIVKKYCSISASVGTRAILSKFLPHLSDMTKPLRHLVQKYTTDHPQQGPRTVGPRSYEDAVGVLCIDTIIHT